MALHEMAKGLETARILIPAESVGLFGVDQGLVRLALLQELVAGGQGPVALFFELKQQGQVGPAAPALRTFHPGSTNWTAKIHWQRHG